jgi:metal-responsive CopG/Arc/MetJ family transcriptional regulator
MAKILVTFEDRLLARIDREAARRGLSRSAYLARLAEGELDERSGPGRSPASRRGLTAVDRLFAETPVTEDPTRAIRRERDSR